MFDLKQLLFELRRDDPTRADRVMSAFRTLVEDEIFDLLLERSEKSQLQIMLNSARANPQETLGLLSDLAAARQIVNSIKHGIDSQQKG